MLLASVVHLGMPDARMLPRGDRLYRPPAAAPLSLKPDGHFHGTMVAEVGRCLGPLALARCKDVASSGTAYGVIGDATGTHRELW